MPYQTILPPVLTLFAILAATLLASVVVSGLQPYRTHLVQVLFWGTAGFCLANGALLVAIIPLMWTQKAIGIGGPLRALLYAAMIPGPYLATAVGLIWGVGFGLRRAARSRRSA